MLKKVDEKELKVRIEAAQSGYKDRKSGVDHFAATDPVSGRAISKFVDGGTVVFQCTTPLDILPTYLEQIENGFQSHPLSIVQIDHEHFDIYFYKPADVQKEALDKIAKEVEAAYLAEIETANEQFIQEQIDAQLRVDAAREQRELAAAEAERRAKVEKQIRETFQPAEAKEPSAPTKGRK